MSNDLSQRLYESLKIWTNSMQPETIFLHQCRSLLEEANRAGYGVINGGDE